MNGIMVLILVVCIAIFAVLAVALMRRLRLAGARQVGCFGCRIVLSPEKVGALFTSPQTGVSRWRSGIAEYRGDAILWYSRFGFSPNPEYIWLRNDLEIESVDREIASDKGLFIVSCLWNQHPVHIALDRESYSGLAAWLESAPPGQPISWQPQTGKTGSMERLKMLTEESTQKQQD